MPLREIPITITAFHNAYERGNVDVGVKVTSDLLEAYARYCLYITVARKTAP